MFGRAEFFLDGSQIIRPTQTFPESPATASYNHTIAIADAFASYYPDIFDADAVPEFFGEPGGDAFRLEARMFSTRGGYQSWTSPRTYAKTVMAPRDLTAETG